MKNLKLLIHLSVNYIRYQDFLFKTYFTMYPDGKTNFHWIKFIKDFDTVVLQARDIIY